MRSATGELADGSFAVAQPVYPQATASQLLVVGRRQRFDATERAVIAVGAALLGLTGRAGADNAALGSAVTALLLDQPAGDVLAGLLEKGQYRVVVGVPRGRRRNGGVSAFDWLSSRLGNPLVRLTDDGGFTAVVATAPSAEVLEEMRSQGWLAVVSSARPADRLGETAAEVDALTQRARALDRPVRADESAGFGLAAAVAPEAAAGFAERALAPLRAIDRARSGDKLADTLHCWLAHHGSWDRTAAALGVHRNSVRHRIGQVERALEADLSDPQVRMELWFALRWSR
ncbi:PucR-like helix-turn-helix protein [Saccharopolyspora erythraea NRRL 2338]|uniref:Regulatory protein n=1 Tax=Saccharopolyspora erythraea (strain ATCC 11635 / DSM 40517 / JCM 4748 / NBRC 13426 / NCIMB 8594 / NRRL 2338) TaxID=405948 RepID=A4FL96_SACEN|nr:PucR family transcriptional regulator [Saccharopolyspora erythraea D]PFG98461.1 PucR-like helix-turn-helix protein [Saccharopolyspora erythraea NRRL 2338]CAM04821.1 regulatory protein [Saccharopolyspora erythraea NRRL 2338]